MNLFFFQAEDGIRDLIVTGVQTCALPIWPHPIGSASVRAAGRALAADGRELVCGQDRPHSHRYSLLSGATALHARLGFNCVTPKSISNLELRTSIVEPCRVIATNAYIVNS